MANNRNTDQNSPPTMKITKTLPHCRCYKIGDDCEMWILDPKSGTYNGPIPCTVEQCRQCNMSQADVVSQ